MKKILKLILVSVLVLSLCFTLGGCNILDTLKETHVLRIDEETVEYKGKTFKLLPENEYYVPQFDTLENINITEKDVPVLLSVYLGTSGEINEDETIISDYEFSRYFCREDIYKEVKKELEADFIESGYCYSYIDYEKGEVKYYTLKKEENEAIKEILAYSEVVIIDDNLNYDYDYSIQLEIYSRNLNFRKEFMQLCYSNGNYFLISFEQGKSVMYKADTSLNPILKKIIKKEVESLY